MAGRTTARAYDIRLHDAWLAAAAGNARIIEPRLTGGFAYGRIRVICRVGVVAALMPRRLGCRRSRTRIRRRIICERSVWRIC